MPADNELHKAAHKGYLEACKVLIEGSVNEEVPITVHDLGAGDRRPLHRAAGAGHIEICSYFLEIGADVNAVSYLPCQCLCHAADTFSISQKDKSGRTPLHWAAISGHSNVVTLLLEKGADILAETTSKTNALHSAVEANRLDTVKILMTAVGEDDTKKAALTTAKNSDERTPWDIAMAAKNTAVCQVLKEMGDINSASSACVIS